MKSLGGRGQHLCAGAVWRLPVAILWQRWCGLRACVGYDVYCSHMLRTWCMMCEACIIDW